MESDEYRQVLELLPRLTRFELSEIYRYLRNSGIGSESEYFAEMAKHDAVSMIATMKEEFGVNVAGKSRDTRTFLCRLCVAEELLGKGYSLKTVGKCLKRSHGTIIYYVNKLHDINRYPQMYPDYVSIRKQYQQKRLYDCNTLQHGG